MNNHQDVLARLDRAHKMSVSDPKNTTIYSQAANVIRELMTVNDIDMSSLEEAYRNGFKQALVSAENKISLEMKEPPRVLTDAAQRVWLGGMDTARTLVKNVIKNLK